MRWLALLLLLVIACGDGSISAPQVPVVLRDVVTVEYYTEVHSGCWPQGIINSVSFVAHWANYGTNAISSDTLYGRMLYGQKVHDEWEWFEVNTINRQSDIWTDTWCVVVTDSARAYRPIVWTESRTRGDTLFLPDTATTTFLF